MEIGPNKVYLPFVACSRRPSSGTNSRMTRDPSRDEANRKTGRNKGEMSSRPQWESGKPCGTPETLRRHAAQYVV